MQDKKLKILTSILGRHYSSSDEKLFHCPRCEHHKQKLSVNIEKNVFKCWVCDYKGKDLYRLVKRYGPYEQRRKWKELTSTVDVENFTSNLFEETAPEDKQVIDLPKEFISLANKKLPSLSAYPMNYLQSRRITKSDIIRWKIGFCPDGEYAGRVIVPSFNEDGDLNYFIARSYDQAWPKYLNPRDANKNIVFNELFLDFDEDLVLVEGVFDAIVAGPNAVPILGSTLRDDHPLIQKIIENDTTIYMGMDSDAKKKELDIIRLLLKYDIEIYKIDTDGCDDIGSMSAQQFRERKQSSSLVNNDNYLYQVIREIL
jgi:DNA primase